MKFKAGMLGLCIVVLSLLIGVSGTVLLNVDKTPVNTTDYDYITDITGLFEASREPQYLNFNPASNYTGYTNSVTSQYNPTGLVFTSTGSANNYRVPTAIATPSAGPSGTVNNDTSTGLISGYTDYITYGISNDEKVNGGLYTAFLDDAKISYLSTWLTSVFGDLSDYSDVVINFTYPATASPTQKAIISATTGTLAPPLAQGSKYVSGNHPSKITVDPSNMTCLIDWEDGTTGGPYSVYDCYISYGNCKQYERKWTPPTQDDPGYWTTYSYDTSASLSYTSVLTTLPNYTYMLPSQGVTNTINTTTIWDNDTSGTNYDNYKIDLLVGYPIVNGSVTPVNGSYVLMLPTGTAGNYDEITITSSTSDNHFRYVYKQYTNNSPQTIKGKDLGAFNSVMVSIEKDASNNVTVKFFGVVDFNNYMDATVSPNALDTVALGFNHDLDNLYMTGSGTLYWSIYNTLVFMDTYDTVLVDPSIDLADYFPDMDSYRYVFQSFALYGDSITINGVTYPIVDQSITINDRAYHLNNFFISFSEQGDTSITFREVNKTISLGDTVNKVVSFNGYWGFNAGLYEGHSSVKDVYEWDIDALGNFDLNTFALFTIGVMLVCCLIAIASRISFRALDKIVVIFSAIVLFCLLGGA